MTYDEKFEQEWDAASKREREPFMTEVQKRAAEKRTKKNPINNPWAMIANLGETIAFTVLAALLMLLIAGWRP